MTAFRVPVARRTERSFAPSLGTRAELVEHESAVLQGNPLGDPHRRHVAVLRPPSGRTEGGPLLVLLPGYGGAGPAELARRGPFEENLFQLFDRLQRSGACGEATLLSPDCLTALGGNQYVNSAAMGRYDDYVVRELIPWARERYRTEGIGVLGQSSGGFGALHLAFEHPGLFGAVGSSAGDMGFEYTYLADLAKACREYQKHGGPENFLGKLFEDPSILKGPTDPSGSALLVAGMAASYSPIENDPGAFELPCDWETSELRPEVWARWKRFDPVARVARPEGYEALRRVKVVAVTGSNGDEWFLDQGARWFASVARRHGLEVVHEEFAGGHFVRGPRFSAIYPCLVAALRA
jgi:enterochelin esterase family protein